MIRFEKVRKVFPQGGREIVALDDLSLEIGEGEFVVVMGPSGSGKSTLLHLAGGLDLPDAGRVTVDGTSMAEMTDRELTLLRRRRIGFVFQFFNLIPTLSVEENVALPLLLDGERLRGARDRVHKLLDDVGLADRRGHLPEQLSGGEMQRVAIARALVTNPALVLADEPTGNLDSVTGREILEVLRRLIGGDGRRRTVLMATHNAAAAEYGDRTLLLRDGRLQ
ncbi:MAG: ABC transporter ATP-binding protein [Planctomycetota bacterium]|nr:ABC transporter ATP-binding protein [Chloroflexota bacterium]MCZ6574460.1 ABC transporter ATP-binding protein [Planctomycetota bacterium]